MDKIKLFEFVFECEKEKDKRQAECGCESRFATMAEFKWFGAIEAVEIAGLFDEYISWRVKENYMGVTE